MKYRGTVFNMICVHQNHALVSRFPTTYSEQTCRKCVSTHYNNVVKLPITKRQNIDDEEVKLVRLHTRHGIYKDANDIRPSEIPDFLNNITLNDHVMNKHRPTWEKEAVELDEVLVSDDANPPETASLTEQKMKDLQFGEKLLREKERLNYLSTEQFYKTSTQKLYEGADWSVFLKPKPPPPLHTLDCNKSFPPPRVKWRGEMVEKPRTLPGQLSWDYLQIRDNEGKENKPLAFTSSSVKTKQIPNYTGVISGSGEKDMANKPFTPRTILRLSKPRYVETSRKPAIPGYAGFTSWDRSKEVFSEEPSPRPESTAGTYKRHDFSGENALYRHRSPLSKTVTLVHPFNCYNKVNYPLFRTVGENRV